MLRSKKIISFFFVALFVSYYVSTNLFSHFHIINGSTVAHSHIHKDSHHDSKSGGHSGYEITLIAQLSHFELINYSNCDLPSPPQFTLNDEKVIKTPHWVTAIHLLNLSLRAPPVLI